MNSRSLSCYLSLCSHQLVWPVVLRWQTLNLPSPAWTASRPSWPNLLQLNSASPRPKLPWNSNWMPFSWNWIPWYPTNPLHLLPLRSHHHQPKSCRIPFSWHLPTSLLTASPIHPPPIPPANDKHHYRVTYLNYYFD